MRVAGRSLVGWALLVCSVGLLAASDPRGLQVGPLQAHPVLGLELSYDDNVFRSPFAEQASLVSVVSPELLLKAKPGRHELSVRLGGDLGRYDNASQNNYQDYQVTGSVHLDLTTRNRFALEAGYFAQHDPIGTNRTEGALRLLEATLLQSEPDRFSILRTGASYSYGAKGARGRVDTYGGYSRKLYQNNREATASLDRAEANVGGIFYWRFRPRTALLLEAQGIRFDYDVANLDSTEVRLLAGVTWRTTAKTSGSVKLGYQRKDLDDTTQVDFAGVAWSVGLQWVPTSYSVVSLDTSRVPQERSGSGLFKVVQEAGFSWLQKWTKAITSTAGFSFADEDFGGSPRADQRWEAGFRLDYQMRPWLALGVGYDYDKRVSNQALFGYDRSIVQLLVQAGFPGSAVTPLGPAGLPGRAPPPP